MGVMRVMGRRGDTAVCWDEEVAVEDATPMTQAEVDAKFREIVAAGFSAFSVTTPGEPATRIDQFDPRAKEIILVPPLQGGS